MADMPHDYAPSSRDDVPNARPVMVDTRPEILVLSSAIRDGLNQAMQPVNATLESLTKTVVALQRKLLPPSHYGLGSEAIDVATPPSAFRRLGAAPPPPSQSGYGGIGPRHGFQPPSFFGLGNTTDMPLEVNEQDPLVEGQGDDTLPIHASDAGDGHISEAEGAESTPQFVASHFAAFSQDIALPVEEKAPALPSDMADCFNSSFQGDLSGTGPLEVYPATN